MLCMNTSTADPGVALDGCHSSLSVTQISEEEVGGFALISRLCEHRSAQTCVYVPTYGGDTAKRRVDGIYFHVLYL